MSMATVLCSHHLATSILASPVVHRERVRSSFEASVSSFCFPEIIKGSGSIGGIYHRQAPEVPPGCSAKLRVRRPFLGSTQSFRGKACTTRSKKYTFSARATASDERAQQIYNGVYGPWKVEDADRIEVIAYRAGLVTAAASFVTASTAAFLPYDNPIKAALLGLLDPLYAVGAGGLGLSLLLIHIYVTPIKRTLQFLWLVGALGSLGVATNFAPPEEGLVKFVLENPGGIWAVGPLFASLTGLVFKEGLCYGKLEAGLMFFVIPSLLLGHLTGVLDSTSELVLLATWMGLFAIFAARKFTQPIKDDIGDKSVFEFMKLPVEQQEALVARLQGGRNTEIDSQ